jgi:hypothetical protein
MNEELEHQLRQEDRDIRRIFWSCYFSLLVFVPLGIWKMIDIVKGWIK